MTFFESNEYELETSSLLHRFDDSNKQYCNFHKHWNPMYR